MTFKALSIAVLGAVALAGSAHAAAIVDTGTPDNQAPWTVSADQWLGGQFSLGEATTITGILGYIEGAADQALTFAVYRDEGTGAPGTELFSRAFSIDGSRGFHGLGGLSWLLDAGSYYVTAEVRRGQTFS